MKTLISAAVALAIACGPAAAYTFSPTDTKFTLRGDVTVVYKGIPIQCRLTLRARSRRVIRHAVVEKASMDGAAPECEAFFFNPPWHMDPRTSTLAIVHGFGMSGAGIGGCGTVLTLTLAGNSWQAASGNRSCTLSGSLASNPALTIAP